MILLGRFGQDKFMNQYQFKRTDKKTSIFDLEPRIATKTGEREMDTIPVNWSQIRLTGLLDYVTGTRTFHNLPLITDSRDVNVFIEIYSWY